MIISSDYNLPSANSGYFVLTDTHLLIYKSIMKDIHKTDQGSKHLESMHKQRCPDSGHFSSERLMLCWTMEYTTVEYTTVTVECTSLFWTLLTSLPASDVAAAAGWWVHG